MRCWALYSILASLFIQATMAQRFLITFEPSANLTELRETLSVLYNAHIVSEFDYTSLKMKGFTLESLPCAVKPKNLEQWTELLKDLPGLKHLEEDQVVTTMMAA